MSSNDFSKPDFARYYKKLELDDKADWETARAKYRRLVNLWHPDRFTNEPNKRKHAQQQFIDVTKAYNELRNFYRKNERLPFQSAHTSQAAHEAHSASPKFKRAKENLAHNNNGPDLDAGILGRDKPEDKLNAIRPLINRNVLWAMAAGTIMLGTVAVFMILDKRAHQATMAIGREVVKEAPESEFLPSASEIRKSQTRGAFVKPTQ